MKSYAILFYAFIFMFTKKKKKKHETIIWNNGVLIFFSFRMFFLFC